MTDSMSTPSDLTTESRFAPHLTLRQFYEFLLTLDGEDMINLGEHTGFRAANVFSTKDPAVIFNVIFTDKTLRWNVLNFDPGFTPVKTLLPIIDLYRQTHPDTGIMVGNQIFQSVRRLKKTCEFITEPRYACKTRLNPMLVLREELEVLNARPKTSEDTPDTIYQALACKIDHFLTGKPPLYLVEDQWYDETMLKGTFSGLCENPRWKDLFFAHENLPNVFRCRGTLTLMKSLFAKRPDPIDVILKSPFAFQPRS